MTEDQKQQLDDLLNVDVGLSSWEMDFIESLEGQQDRALTDRQVEKLEELVKCYL